MKRTMIKPTFPLLVGALLLWCAAPQTPAVPYATCVTNQGGTVSFRLNEAADNVKIISSNGTVTNDLGAGVKGLTVINLGLAAGDIRVMVTRSAAAGYTQSSDDAYQDNGVYVNKYEHPRGVVVDRNPASPAFGRIYIANARGNAATENPVRNVYQGIYMLNADNTVALDTGEFPRTAGLMFTPGNTASPTRLVIGKDDGQLYLCDWSDPSGGLWVTDPDVTTGMNVFDGIGDLIYGSYNHGSVPAAWIEGRAGVDLKIYTVDEDMAPGDNLWRYDIGNTALPFAGMPTQLFGPQIQGFSGVMDLVRGGGGKLFLSFATTFCGNGTQCLRADGNGHFGHSLAAGYPGFDRRPGQCGSLAGNAGVGSLARRKNPGAAACGVARGYAGAVDQRRL